MLPHRPIHHHRRHGGLTAVPTRPAITADTAEVVPLRPADPDLAAVVNNPPNGVVSLLVVGRSGPRVANIGLRR